MLRPDGRSAAVPLGGVSGVVTDAATLPSGAIWAIERAPSWKGFQSRLVQLTRSRNSFEVSAAFSLPLGPTDNPEGLAAEPMPDGKTRLWLITDDNFQEPFRTLLLAVDLPH
jgi:hypothetical protein